LFQSSELLLLMITSSQNPKIQWVRSLQTQPQARREQQACVIEGVRLAEEALAAGWKARLVLYSEEISPRGLAVVERFTSQQAPVEQITPRVMKSASDTETPQGLLVAISVRSLPLPPNPDFLLILDEVRDPGNLGSILRTAYAAGVQAVLLSPGTADPFAPKVLRSAMGAHFHLPIKRASWDELYNDLRLPVGYSLQVFLADSGGGRVYTQADFRSPLALVVGSEAQGAGAEAIALAWEKIHIPMPGGAESLNAAIATGILLFEVVRQRGILV
jgi:TrmH family RNA methyltransferase